MPTYKALITDLDDTAVPLASDGSDVDAETVAAIQTATDNGYVVTCATGRSWHLVKPVVDALGLTGACIIQGGTKIIDSATEETLWEKHLETSAISQVFDIFHAHNVDGRLVSHDPDLDTTFSLVDKPPTASSIMYLLAIETSVAVNVCNEINQLNTTAVAHPTPSWAGRHLRDIHVTHRLATKEHAIAAWHKLTGINKAETIGMGDSANDVPLFESSGLKVAVGNATEEIIELADYIAPAQKDGALRHVIETFLV